jgi:competence protein ComEC
MLQGLGSRGTHIHMIRAGFQITEGHVGMKCVWPPPDQPLRNAENDRSLVFLLKTPRLSFLMTGDLPSTMEKRLPLLNADVLKVGHHGSRHSSSSPFLEQLKPKVCVVSVGVHNTYGHPNPEALERMELANCTILRTDRLGDIVFPL